MCSGPLRCFGMAEPQKSEAAIAFWALVKGPLGATVLHTFGVQVQVASSSSKIERWSQSRIRQLETTGGQGAHAAACQLLGLRLKL